jgi:hypothetical protein
LIIINYIDWRGTPEELEVYLSAAKKACNDTPGARYMGIYSPVNKNFGWAVFVEVENYSTLNDVYKNFHYERDLKILPREI